MDDLKNKITSYVDEYLSDYYPDQQQGEFTGDKDDLTDRICDYDENLNRDDVRAAISEMLANGSLETDSREWINPENDQYTVYVDIITTRGFCPEPSEWTSIRRNSRSWGYSHPQNYETVGIGGAHETFEEWRDSEIQHIQERINAGVDEDAFPVTIKKLKSWKDWDDVDGSYDVM